MTAGEAEDFRIGTVLRGKYTLNRVLGAGGMAVVYEATHRNRKRFAIKVLRLELSVSADIRARFLREGYVANSVEHAGAVTVLDDDVAEDGSAFIVMELLDGAPLDAIVSKFSPPRMPWRATLSIGVQLLDVLAAAHAHGIVHRDIKPQNLFLKTDGTLKVLDFGIARIREAAAAASSQVHATRTGAMVGTPAFMPPEQALGRSREIDQQTDIWAVGATLFSLLSGVFVHDATTGQEMVVKAATERPRSLGAVASDIPPAIVEVVDRALAFDKSARWPDAKSMREALVAAHVASFGDAPSTSSALALVVDQPMLELGTSPTVAATAPLPLQSKRSSLHATTHAPVSARDVLAPTPRSRWLVGAGVAAFGVVAFTTAAVSLRWGRTANSSTAFATTPAIAVSAPSTTASSAITSTPAVGIDAATGPVSVDVLSLPRATTIKPAATVRPAASCDPPYTIASNGKHIPKPECL